MKSNQKRVEIIAEVAQGYEGNSKLTDLLTTGAILSGADAIKYQLVYADELATPQYAYYDLFKSLEMDEDKWIQISDRIHENGQKLYFDIFGIHSLFVAKTAKADGVKLSTTEFFNRSLILQALATFDHVIISIAGIPISELDELLSSISNEDQKKVCLMYGFQAEPTPLEQNNLLKLNTYKERYPTFRIGFMDHSDGSLNEAFCLSLVVLGIGVNTIEKHITLDRELKIEDYISALDATNFKNFVTQIHEYEPSLGSSDLSLTEAEILYQKKAGKVVVALCDLKAGAAIREEHVSLKRVPEEAVGTRLKRLDEVVGKILAKPVAADSLVSEENII